MGLSVSTAKTPTVALEKFSQESFSLVITDLRIPGQSGLSLAEDFRSKRPDLPILIISGGDIGTEENQQAASRLGGLHFLAKPFDLATFLSLVRLLIGEEVP